MARLSSEVHGFHQLTSYFSIAIVIINEDHWSIKGLKEILSYIRTKNEFRICYKQSVKKM